MCHAATKAGKTLCSTLRLREGASPTLVAHLDYKTGLLRERITLARAVSSTRHPHTSSHPVRTCIVRMSLERGAETDHIHDVEVPRRSIGWVAINVRFGAPKAASQTGHGQKPSPSVYPPVFSPRAHVHCAYEHGYILTSAMPESPLSAVNLVAPLQDCLVRHSAW